MDRIVCAVIAALFVLSGCGQGQPTGSDDGWKSPLTIQEEAESWDSAAVSESSAVSGTAEPEIGVLDDDPALSYEADIGASDAQAKEAGSLILDDHVAAVEERQKQIEAERAALAAQAALAEEQTQGIETETAAPNSASPDPSPSTYIEPDVDETESALLGYLRDNIIKTRFWGSGDSYYVSPDLPSIVGYNMLWLVTMVDRDGNKHMTKDPWDGSNVSGRQLCYAFDTSSYAKTDVGYFEIAFILTKSEQTDTSPVIDVQCSVEVSPREPNKARMVLFDSTGDEPYSETRAFDASAFFSDVTDEPWYDGLTVADY